MLVCFIVFQAVLKVVVVSLDFGGGPRMLEVRLVGMLRCL